MCQYKSGIAVKVSETEVRIYYLPTEDSHSKIRKYYNLVDDDSIRSRYQTPVELIPVRGLEKIEDFEFKFDAERPEWWNEDHTESAKSQLFSAHLENYRDKKIEYKGELWLNSLKEIPEGVSLSAGGSLYLYSLKKIPKGVSLSAGWDLDLRSLKKISEGVSLSAGGSLWLYSLKEISEGVSLSAGGNLCLHSLEKIPEGVNVKADKVYLKVICNQMV